MKPSIFGLNEEPRAAYTGCELIENVDGQIINELYTGGGFPLEELATINKREHNMCFVLRNGSQSVLARVSDGNLVRIQDNQAYGIKPRNAEQAMALDVLLDDSIPLVTVTGRAGTGKTLLAFAAALERSRDYLRIMLARPIVPLGEKDIGFLPGGVEDKVAPYMLPLYDNLSIIKHAQKGNRTALKRIERMLEEDKIVIEPLAYIRGRSLSRAYMIVDEAQNLDEHDLKTIITRAGEGTKIVFTGDIEQIDVKKMDAQHNGLNNLVRRFKGQRLYAHINLEKGERSELAEMAAQLL